MIAAAFSPDTIFAFLLNSSGAIILFVYLLIAISQIVLRFRTPDDELKVKMWLFPVLSLLTAAAIVAILVQMYLQDAARSQLVLSLLSWAVVIVLFFANKWFVARRPAVQGVAADLAAAPGARAGQPDRRVRRTARRTARDRRRQGDRTTVVVPASPIETGTAATHGPLDLWEATQAAAAAAARQHTTALRTENLDADGELGDYRPLRALAAAVDAIPSRPDRDRDAAARIVGLASLRRRRPRPSRVRHTGDHDVVARCGAEEHSRVTILVGFSASRQSDAPVNLAAQNRPQQRGTSRRRSRRRTAVATQGRPDRG